MKTKNAIALLEKHGFHVVVLPRGRLSVDSGTGYRLTWSNGGLSGNGMMKHVKYEHISTGRTTTFVCTREPKDNAQKVRDFIFIHDKFQADVNGVNYRLRWREDVTNNLFGKEFVLCYAVIGRRFRHIVPQQCHSLAVEVHASKEGMPVLIDAMQDAGVEVYVQCV